jgi:hypothetical protein
MHEVYRLTRAVVPHFTPLPGHPPTPAPPLATDTPFSKLNPSPSRFSSASCNKQCWVVGAWRKAEIVSFSFLEQPAAPASTSSKRPSTRATRSPLSFAGPTPPLDPRAHIVSGDVTDAAAIATAARGHDAVISTLGVKSVRKTPTLITDTVRAVIGTVIASAQTSGVDRFVIVSAFGVGESLAKASFIAGFIFRTALRKKYEDKAASEVLLKASDLQWTLEYPGALNDRAGGGYTAVPLADLRILPSTSRVNVADFLLRSAVESTFIRRVVVVTNTT